MVSYHIECSLGLGRLTPYCRCLGGENNWLISPFYSLEGKVKETMHNAFWDHLKEQLSASPPDFSCAVELLKEIKEVSNLPSICRSGIPRHPRLIEVSAVNKS